jgi:hypothetical protein
VIYVHLQLFDNEKKTKKWMYPLIILNVAHGILVIVNQFSGWFYIIDENNIYHHGPLFILSGSFTIILLILATGMILFNRKRVRDKYYFSLLIFIIPPAISIVLQIYIYGTSLMLNSVVLSLLIVFLNVQNQSIYTDHLTGINNRKLLDKYLKNKIESNDNLLKKLDSIVPLKSTVNTQDVAIYQMDEESGTISLLTNYEGIPSDSNFLNDSLAKGNRLFDSLLEIEQEL